MDLSSAGSGDNQPNNGDRDGEAQNARSGNPKISSLPKLDSIDVPVSSIDQISAATTAVDAALLQRRREMSTIYSRRKRQRLKIKIEILRDECSKFSTTNLRLSEHNQRPTDAIDKANGRRLILSTGCVTMITSPLSNIQAARDVVEPAA